LCRENVFQKGFFRKQNFIDNSHPVENQKRAFYAKWEGAIPQGKGEN